MLRYLFIILACLAVDTLVAQQVTKVFFYQEGQKVIINYDLTGIKLYQTINISVYVSTDGGKIYNGPLKKVDGDVGLNITPGKGKKIVWDVFEEMPDFEGEVSFEVRAVVNEEKPERKIYVGYKGSYLAPLGVVIGTTGKTGYYLSVRTDLFYLRNNSSDFYKTEGETIQNYEGPGYYIFTQEHRTPRFSVTGGLSFRLSRNFRLYAGGGYSVNDVLWKINRFDYNNVKTGSEWVKNTKESYSFPEVESGLWLQLKPVFISAGISVCGNKWIDGTISAGVVF